MVIRASVDIAPRYTYRGRRVGERERGIEWRNLLQRATEGGRERDGVRRKKEWMGALCARWLGGVAASRRRTTFYTLREIRSHCYFITGRDPRSYNTKGPTDDNCHAIDLWQSTAFYGLARVYRHEISTKSEGIESVGAVYSSMM